jgi:hypothetical protein
MKLKELLNEGVTDIVARFYVEAGRDFDKYYNREDVEYKDKQKGYYDEHFKSWFAEEIVPVFTKPVTQAQPPYTNKPKAGRLQSPGYRGQQYAKAHADMPYDHKVQRYDPEMSIAPTADVDAFINNSN